MLTLILYLILRNKYFIWVFSFLLYTHAKWFSIGDIFFLINIISYLFILLFILFFLYHHLWVALKIDILKYKNKLLNIIDLSLRPDSVWKGYNRYTNTNQNSNIYQCLIWKCKIWAKRPQKWNIHRCYKLLTHQYISKNDTVAFCVIVQHLQGH